MHENKISEKIIVDLKAKDKLAPIDKPNLKFQISNFKFQIANCKFIIIHVYQTKTAGRSAISVPLRRD